MVPTDYRLDQVAAKLVERLEGTRRSFPDPAKAQVEFDRIAAEYVDAALGEYRELAVDDPAHHDAFLRKELLETFLPRYHKLATAMTAREDRGFGLYFVMEPVGRLVVAAMAVLPFFYLARFAEDPLDWLPLVALLAVPVLPDVVRILWRRRYAGELQALVDDMARIQAQDDAWLRPEARAIEDRPMPRARDLGAVAPEKRPDRESEGS